MKTIYKKYCNDIQNPALGAYLIYVFSNTFYQERGICSNLLDIFIFIPLIMVRDVRELIFWFDNANKSHQIKKISKLYEKIEEHLTVFKAEELIDKQVCNLSGGELQRVLLSMAVMDEPNLLLLDEPVSGIDQNGMDLFYHTISELKRHYDLAIILISHDLDYVAQCADQVILIDGTVKKQGTVRQVYESEEFQEVFGKFDLENYKPSRQVKGQKEKEIAMPKHNHSLWKEDV